MSSTWFDLQPERAAVEEVLQRFREAKFVGMEYFGSRDETTRATSLAEVDRSDLYIGIVGGRYGSGITAAEYARARRRKLPCFAYFKQEAAIPPEGRDPDQSTQSKLERFKAMLRSPRGGHTVSDFSAPYELASHMASDLHGWLIDRYYAPAIGAAASGRLGAVGARAIRADLSDLSAWNRELRAKVADERRRLDAQRRVALQAFYELTYVVPEVLARFPDTSPLRERIVRKNLVQLDRLLELDEGAHDVLRELATNHRSLGTILLERRKWSQAHSAFKTSARYSASLVRLQPENDLYHRDLAASHLNAGYALEQRGDLAAARAEYRASVPSARRAAELDRRWAELLGDAESRAGRLPPGRRSPR